MSRGDLKLRFLSGAHTAVIMVQLIKLIAYRVLNLPPVSNSILVSPVSTFFHPPFALEFKRKQKSHRYSRVVKTVKKFKLTPLVGFTIS